MPWFERSLVISLTGLFKRVYSLMSHTNMRSHYTEIKPWRITYSKPCDCVTDCTEIKRLCRPISLDTHSFSGKMDWNNVTLFNYRMTPYKRPYTLKCMFITQTFHIKIHRKKNIKAQKLGIETTIHFWQYDNVLFYLNLQSLPNHKLPLCKLSDRHLLLT